MTKLIAALAVALCGCGTLNSPPTKAHSTLEMKKCCGCGGMEGCSKNSDGSTCCTPTDCKCKEITAR